MQVKQYTNNFIIIHVPVPVIHHNKYRVELIHTRKHSKFLKAT